MGRYSRAKSSRSRSATVASTTGLRSNGRSAARRRSDSRRSISAEARRRLGPTRTQAAPLKRTGGLSAGSTSTTATSHPPSIRFRTRMTGGGRMLPSAHRSERFRSSSSVMGSREHCPLSSTPMKITPSGRNPGDRWQRRRRSCGSPHVGSAMACVRRDRIHGPRTGPR